MDTKLLVVRPRWTTVASIVSKRLGKIYGGDYIQQVSSGIRTNAKVAEILHELGMMKEQIEQITPPKPRIGRRATQAIAA